MTDDFQKAQLDAVKEYAVAVGMDWQDVARSIGIPVPTRMIGSGVFAQDIERVAFLAACEQAGWRHVAILDDPSLMVYRVIAEHRSGWSCWFKITMHTVAREGLRDTVWKELQAVAARASKPVGA